MPEPNAEIDRVPENSPSGIGAMIDCMIICRDLESRQARIRKITGVDQV